MKRRRSPKPLALPNQSLGRSHQERYTEGKHLRESCSRAAQGQWKFRSRREDPIAILLRASRGGLKPLLPIRYGRMMANPFAFFRGSACLMAHDLAQLSHTRIHVVACGDSHLMNFGGFATPERRLIFDINDFDETSVAPWEWDVKRLAASLVIAGRHNDFKEDDSREAAWWAAHSYRENMLRYAEMGVLEAYYEYIDLEELIGSLSSEDIKRLYRKRLKRATSKGAHELEFSKLAFQAGKNPRIIDNPPLIYHHHDIQREKEFYFAAEQRLAQYGKSLAPERRLLLDRYRLVDFAFKVVGIGSVGLDCGIALLISGNGDPLFLQIKEARRSVLEPYCGALPFQQHGERVVVGQRIMQAASDLFLGWFRAGERHYYVRQLRDATIKPVVETMRPRDLKIFARFCGWALARAHKRSGDSVKLSGYMGKNERFEDAIALFAGRYADQNARDYKALLAAIRSGRVEAEKPGE